MNYRNVSVKKTLCHGCTRRCGLVVYVDENGKPVKLEGDKEQPMSKGFFCARGRALVFEQPFHKDRLKRPLKRVGERGQGKWQPISWDQALDEIATKLKEIKEKYGAEAIACVLDTAIGLGFAGVRFMNLLGSPNRFTLGGQVCYGNGYKMDEVTYGVDTASDRANSMCTVVWGCNPAISKPEWFRYIKESIRKGGKVITVDPLCTECAKISNIWLQIRPGSDGAMMMAWLNIIINEDLYDRDFVEKWTNAPYLVRLDLNRLLRESDIVAGGDPEKFMAWDPSTEQPIACNREPMSNEQPSVKPPLTGEYVVTLADGKKVECKTVWQLLKERVAKYTPEKVAEITWVPADKIMEAARMYATTKPANFFGGLATDLLGPSANQCARARAILRAITGNLGVKGGEVILGPFPKVNSDTAEDKMPPEQMKKTLGADRFRIWTWESSQELFKYQKKVGYHFPSQWYGAHAPTVWRAILTGKPYPVKALIVVGSNPLVTGANTKLIYKALMKLDLLVTHDLYMTPTADLSDYVTPGTMDEIEQIRLHVGFAGTGWLEGHSIMSSDQAIKPPGEAWSDFRFWRELGVRMGQEWPWKTEEEYYDWQLEPLGYTFREFHNKVHFLVPQPEYKQYEKTGFGTPSGKVEIFSSHLRSKGYDPLPEYEEPPNSPVSTPKLAEEYPYIQATARLRGYYISQYRQLESIRKMRPDPLILINPETATKLGIKDGDWVWIESPLGKDRIKQRAKLVSSLHPRVVYPDPCWWFPEKSEPGALHGVWESNVNVIIDDALERCCPMIGSWNLNANLVKIYKA